MNITAHTTNRHTIQELLKKFEKNKNNQRGIAFLQSALEKMIIILEETKDIYEAQFIHNSSCKYRNVVIEMSKKVKRNGTPSLDELNLIVDYMHLFNEYKFDDDPDFKDAYDKTLELRKMIAKKTEPDTISRKVVYERLIAGGVDNKTATEISGYTPKDSTK